MSVLGLFGSHDASIGVKKPGPGQGLQQAVPAKEWAAGARRDVRFLSLVATSKGEMLHGLARTKSPAPLHIQVAEQPPRPLADWVREVHPDSKGIY